MHNRLRVRGFAHTKLLTLNRLRSTHTTALTSAASSSSSSSSFFLFNLIFRDYFQFDKNPYARKTMASPEEEKPRQQQ